MRPCSFCGKEIKRKNYYDKYLTVSCLDCRSISRSERNRKQQEVIHLSFIEEWKLGNKSGMKGKTSTSAHIKKYLFRRCNSACEKCGWNKINEATGRVPLEINHKDGNFRNNKEENLELICPNCHSLTFTYRSLNKGNGRPR